MRNREMIFEENLRKVNQDINENTGWNNDIEVISK
jgi:hypothetical protein